MTIALTGDQHTIAADGYQAVVTEVGAALGALSHDGRPLTMPHVIEEPPPGAAGVVLMPWPNRIADGRYTFDGEDRQLSLTEPTSHNAIHGLVRTLPWQVADKSAASVRLALRLFPQAGYPHLLDLSVSYALGPGGLTVELSAANAGATPAPYGFGCHPYLTMTPATELELPAGTWIESDKRGIPVARHPVDGGPYDFRTRRAVGDAKLDTAFTGLRRDADGLVRVRVDDVELWAGPGVKWLQLFTGDTLSATYRRKGLAVEPMSCPPNAFATGEDVIRLEPGATATHRWGITVSAAAV
ncbi:aldose 1-epimerase family protein [Streptosporangiaceae bacterium NEAU-GS5]|nr:aldose 1-epimerase family protein [Streptosporangiaceae bacterium NEAU-GS5]